jgi:hypothetical protein
MFQQQASQRYRQNLKEKSKQVEDELVKEEIKNEKLKKFLNEIEQALGTLSISLINQTKIEDFGSLINTLEKSGLNYTAKNIKERIPTTVEEISIPIETIPISVEIVSIGIEEKMEDIIPEVQLKLPSKHVTAHEDDDCQVNRFQELFGPQIKNDEPLFERLNSITLTTLVDSYDLINFKFDESNQTDINLMLSIENEN